jgi:alginate O-acetyltransferase complex protein AlgI
MRERVEHEKFIERIRFPQPLSNKYLPCSVRAQADFEDFGLALGFKKSPFMLFTTGTFLLFFLPITWAGFFLLGRQWPSIAAAWLFLASLFFYAYWMPIFTLLLGASIAINFLFGRCISVAVKIQNKNSAKFWLVIALFFNLGLLGYFKYANFFIENINALLGQHWNIAQVILPIGISFYTFTQIAFLADAYEGKVSETDPLHYGLFVTYFPHLIAGPVLHHSQMMPQFADSAIYRVRCDQLVGGLAIFALGLFKKVVLADGIAPYADAVFIPVDGGLLPSTMESWLGAVAYTLQLYFDFSGYSDMAIGLSWMFNIKLPFNFDSPYKARNIADFWRRWHISLSTFLRDYLYVPLGGNRRGTARRYLNLAVTMVLGGLWHGASWSFVVWGALHGAYLLLHQAYRALLGEARCARLGRSLLNRNLSWLLTLLLVVFSWVFFRATTFSGALRMAESMLTIRSADGAVPALLWNAGLHASTGFFWCAALMATTLFAPNSNRIGVWVLAVLAPASPLRALGGGAALCAIMLLLMINTARDAVSAFIYFNF